MSFFVGRPLPAWNTPVQLGPPPPPGPPPPHNPTAPAPQFGGYYQPPELITKLYHKLSIIDYDLRCPIDLIHLIVKAAMRDPVVAQDIDLLVAQRSQEFRPPPQQPQNGHQPPPNPPMPGSSQSRPVATPQVPARGTLGSQPTPVSAQPQAPAPFAAPATAQPAGSRGQARPSTPPRNGTSSASSASSSDQRDESPEILIGGVPLRSIRSPPVIPRCPRPAKSAAELRVPQKASASTRGRRSNGRNDVVDLTNEEEAPEPHEKPADYSKLLEMTEKDLGWHGKYDDVSDRRQITLGIQVSIKIEKLLERLRGYMETNKSFPNRVHILTVMREIIMAPLLTESSRIGREVRNSAFQYDDNFIWAVEKLTEGQKSRLKILDDGKWVEGLGELIELANAYCSFPKLREALAAIDPDAAAAYPERDY